MKLLLIALIIISSLTISTNCRVMVASAPMALGQVIGKLLLSLFKSLDDTPAVIDRKKSAWKAPAFVSKYGRHADGSVSR
jgi:hypothetical protein